MMIWEHTKIFKGGGGGGGGGGASHPIHLPGSAPECVHVQADKYNVFQKR